ncbi:hypothetical protein B0H12DRAFT_1142241, partial [Mycena haematopus]
MRETELHDAYIFLCSPLTRAMQTAVATFGGVFDAARVVVVENCREEHVHTCDKQSTRTQLETALSEDKYKSHFEFEPTFAGTDLIWLPDLHETHAQ